MADIYRRPKTRHVAQALRQGAFGYLLKDSASVELLNVVEAVADGRRFLRQRAASLAVEGFIAKSESEAVQSLSGHEREVILMAVREGWVRVDE